MIYVGGCTKSRSLMAASYQTRCPRQFAGAFTAPVVGGLLDRFGARILLAAAALIAGAAMASLSLVDDGWQIILVFAITGLVGLNGPGALVTSVPVTRWFVRKRGKA